MPTLISFTQNAFSPLAAAWQSTNN